MTGIYKYVQHTGDLVQLGMHLMGGGGGERLSGVLKAD